jgi:hypothetical protein
MRNNFSGIFPAIPFELALFSMQKHSGDGSCWLVAHMNMHRRYVRLQSKGVVRRLEPDSGWGQMATLIAPDAVEMFLGMFSRERPNWVKIDSYDTDLLIYPHTPERVTPSPWFTAHSPLIRDTP